MFPQVVWMKSKQTIIQMLIISLHIVYGKAFPG